MVPVEQLLAAARAAEESGELNAALAMLESAAPEVQRAGIYHYVLGAMRARAGDLDGAIGALERAVAIEPMIPEYLGNLGAALLEAAHRRLPTGRPEIIDPVRLSRALEVLDAAAMQSPKLPEVHSNRALALLLCDHAADAVASCDHALALHPEHLPALYNKAIALHELGRADECLKCLDECLRIDPELEPARNSREHLLGALGRRR